MVGVGARLNARPMRAIEENGLSTGSLMTDQKPPTRIRERVRLHQNADSSADIQAPLPPNFDFVFEDRPLLPGEDADQYDVLRESIVQQVKPADVIEAIWVKDIIDLTWEAKRSRRMRNRILVQARMKAVVELILPAFQKENSVYIEGITGPSVETLAAGWASGNESSTGRVNKYLQDRDLSAEDVTAHAFLLNLSAIERVDRLIFLVEHRRDALIREIERKRASLAQRLRAAPDILDVEHVVSR